MNIGSLLYHFSTTFVVDNGIVIPNTINYNNDKCVESNGQYTVNISIDIKPVH